MPFGLQAVTLRIAAVGRIDGAKEIGRAKAGGESGRWNSIRRDSREGRGAPAVDLIALAVGQNAVELPVIIRIHPRAVVVIHLAAVKEVARRQLFGNAEHTRS